VGPDGSIQSAGYWADWALAHRPHRGRAVTLPVFLPRAAVPQPEGPRPLWLVVPTYTFLRNAQPDRWVLLTCGRIDQHAGPRQVRHEYALRWRAEDGKRLLGQIWHVERFLVRSFLALERLLWCVCLAGGFLAMLQREEPALCRQLESEVLYLNEDCTLPGYRLARGMQAAAVRAVRMPMLSNA